MIPEPAFLTRWCSAGVATTPRTLSRTAPAHCLVNFVNGVSHDKGHGVVDRQKGLCGLTMQPRHPIVNLAENYLGFNCSVVFAENYIVAAPASEPLAPVSLYPVP